MLEIESKEQPSVKFWISELGYLCIEQNNLEHGMPVVHALGPDAVDLLAANIDAIVEAQRKTW